MTEAHGQCYSNTRVEYEIQNKFTLESSITAISIDPENPSLLYVIDDYGDVMKCDTSSNSDVCYKIKFSGKL